MHSIETLLTRNLREVFGEHDPVRRQAAIAALFQPEAVFLDWEGELVGHAALAERVTTLQARTAGWVFEPVAPPQAVGDAGRLAWRFGPPGAPPRVTGLDVILAREGKIARLYTFLDPRA
jgi:hypothetical protein